MRNWSFESDQESLLKNVSDDLEGVYQPRRASTPRRDSEVFAWIITAIAVIALFATLASKVHNQLRVPDDLATYSPAEDVVEMRHVVYTNGIGRSRSIYQGPSTPERDKAWDDLYNFAGLTRIPRASAAKLVNKTVPIPGDPGYYIVTLSVFHELHCLNLLRKRLWMTELPAPSDHAMANGHLSHCINTLRQAVMCSADITPIPRVWVEKDQANRVLMDVQHTCRNFDKIREWAVENRIRAPYNASIYVPDDLI